MGFPFSDDKIERLKDTIELLCILKPDSLLYFYYRCLLWYRRNLLEIDAAATSYLFPGTTKTGDVDFSTGNYLTVRNRFKVGARDVIKQNDLVKNVPSRLVGLRTIPMQRDAKRSLLKRLRLRGPDYEDQLSVLSAIKVLEDKQLTDPTADRFTDQELVGIEYRPLTINSVGLPVISNAPGSLTGTVDGTPFDASVLPAEPASLMTASAETRFTLDSASFGETYEVVVNGHPYIKVATAFDTPETVLEALRQLIAGGAEPGVLAEIEVFARVVTLVLSGVDYSCMSTSSNPTFMQTDGFDFTIEDPTSTAYSISSVSAFIGSLTGWSLATASGDNVDMIIAAPAVDDAARSAYLGAIVRIRRFNPTIEKLWLRVIGVTELGADIRLLLRPVEGGLYPWPSPWPDLSWDHPTAGAYLYHDNRFLVYRDGNTAFYEVDFEHDGTGITAAYIALLIDGAVIAPTAQDVQVQASEVVAISGRDEVTPGGALGFYPVRDLLETPDLSLEISEISGSFIYSFDRRFYEISEVTSILNSGTIPVTASVSGNKIVVNHDELGPYYLDVTIKNSTLGLPAQRVWGSYTTVVPDRPNSPLVLAESKRLVGKVTMTVAGAFTFTGFVTAPDDGQVMFIPEVGYRRYVTAGPALDFPIPADTEFSIYSADDHWRLVGGRIEITSGYPHLGLEQGIYTGGVLRANPTPELNDVYFDGSDLHRYLETGWDPPITDRVVAVTLYQLGATYEVELDGAPFTHTAVGSGNAETVLRALQADIEAAAIDNVVAVVRNYGVNIGLHISGVGVIALRTFGGGGMNLAPIVTARHYVSHLLKTADLSKKPYGDIILRALSGERVAELPDISWWREWDPEVFDYTDKPGLAFLDALIDSGFDVIFNEFRAGRVYGGYLDFMSGKTSAARRLRTLLKRRFGESHEGDIPINQSTFIPEESEGESPEKSGDFSGDFDEVY